MRYLILIVLLLVSATSADGQRVHVRGYGDADLDAQCRAWLDHVANRRVHGTTGAVPQECFEAEERATLKPLATRPYRSLVLTPERERRATVPRSLASVPAVAVEQRSLAAYTRLVALAEEVA